MVTDQVSGRSRKQDMSSARTTKPFGEAMRELLAEQGHSLRWLAEQVGVDIAYLVRIGQGRKAPSTKVIKLAASALGVPSDYFREIREEIVAEYLKDHLELTDQIYVGEFRGDPGPARRRRPKSSGDTEPRRE
jgi:transcriptional regulator with XRE-family HTH domain